MTTRSILVIDDEESWLRFMRRVLADCGYEVHTALTCAAGLELAVQLEPDCILLDFHLTDGDAVSVCAALNSGENTRGLPVIVISGDPAAEIAAYAECRAAAFLEKGTRCTQTIPAAIERILRERHGAPAIGGCAKIQE